ncbi:ketopantoate reductase family protein [Roseibacterium sp. SDUM158016]|uniref:ketopantoate reductase family protein n=1 Tax=Roseicyclus sediminis TaxID=2980997 RepID=UPI0021D348B4|nr:2-dehydropantoate 2-reductase N-terminal domain-containing protein [Roseibacterium sp. SDUM158016]MCU4652470.1 ketopantoate reductase family protein [Roseibacterium sp. SDUM158016]
MRVVLYGLGAVGGTIAAALANAGVEVAGIARGAMLEALHDRPLRLRHPGGEIVVTVPCFGTPAEVDFRPDDLICLTMKSQDTEAALLELRAAGVRNQAIFCLQNGIANEPRALRFFPNVHGVTVMTPAGYAEPGEVLCHGTPKLGMFDIGRFPSGSDDADRALADAFDRAGMAGFVHEDVMSSKRGKLLLNLGNALEASLGRGTERGDWPARVRTEAEAVFRAAGLAWDDVGMDAPRRKELMQMGDIPGEARFGGSTSQSLLRGTGRVETDYLNGEIAWLARMHGMEAPANAFLADLMDRIAASGAGPGSLSLADLDARFAAWERGEAPATPS